jgi:hypothetical protein
VSSRDALDRLVLSDLDLDPFQNLYCTFPVTDPLALIVKVQLLALLPPLEQAPDQMASRPLLAVKVIKVPLAKFAEAVLPTATFMPIGLDVRRSPLRPLAVTVKLTLAPGGLMVSVAVRVTPA